MIYTIIHNLSKYQCTHYLRPTRLLMMRSRPVLLQDLFIGWCTVGSSLGGCRWRFSSNTISSTWFILALCSFQSPSAQACLTIQLEVDGVLLHWACKNGKAYFVQIQVPNTCLSRLKAINDYSKGIRWKWRLHDTTTQVKSIPESSF